MRRPAAISERAVPWIGAGAWLTWVLLTLGPPTELAWGLSLLLLAPLGAMGLAVLYGARDLLELPWLDLPFMRAWHGTANALGFALPAALAGTLLPRVPATS